LFPFLREVHVISEDFKN